MNNAMPKNLFAGYVRTSQLYSIPAMTTGNSSSTNNPLWAWKNPAGQRPGGIGVVQDQGLERDPITIIVIERNEPPLNPELPLGGEFCGGRQVGCRSTQRPTGESACLVPKLNIALGCRNFLQRNSPFRVESMARQALSGHYYSLAWLKLGCNEKYKNHSRMSGFFTIFFGQILN